MEQEKIDKAKEWWYEISDHQTTELIMKHKLRKPIKDTDIVKLFAIYSVSFAKRKVCSIGISYEKCSEHPLNELGCLTCEKFIEQT